ncbi:substrate-specific activator of APC-dependent proteolysis [Coemansia sp. RSA 2336]|nr:substrate-specific activator of APC-dependent proteolysis [Coemansia sp. RSA 2336]
MWDEEFGKRVQAASSRKKKGEDSETSGTGSSTKQSSKSRSRAKQPERETAGPPTDTPQSSAPKRSMRVTGTVVSGKSGVNRPPLPPQPTHRSRPAASSAGDSHRKKPAASISKKTSSQSSRSTRRTRHERHRHSRSSDGYEEGHESPTLDVTDVAADKGVGVVTRSMARRMQTQSKPAAAGSVTKPALVSQSSSESTAATASAPLSRSQSAEDAHTLFSSPVRTDEHQDTPENHLRVRRSPQFNYDRFIPARSPDSAIDLRRYEKSHRASSPVYSRKPTHVEHQAQVDEANRTYDALLRSELLNDRSAVDDFSPNRRLRSSSPPPASSRPTSRRELYNLSSSPNQLPSLVPWSSSAAGGSSSRPTTPPHSPPMASPVFMYRSPRKASLGSPSSMPTLHTPHARNLFGRASPVHEVYQQTALSKESRRILSPRRAPRRIPKDPVKVLDAPGIRDDYYLNLMDWSTSNRISVALNSQVYVWDAQSSQTSQLCDVSTDNSEEWVTSVGWAENGKHLAIGLHSGSVQIWDVNRGRKIRTFAGHTRRVGVVNWNQSVVSTGGRDKRIFNYDTRMRQSAIVSTYYGHSQEVCGLKWSPDRTQLASGGNDNMLLIWDTRFTPLDSRVSSYHPDIAPGSRVFRRPLFRLDAHVAAVKALAWSPTQRGLLASGGGTEDRCIKFWDTHAGQSISSFDTRSQVCNLSWAHDGSEIVSSQGYSDNHVIVWRYPAMQPVSVLTGHTRRVLYMAHSPDGKTIATAAGDETIRFWEVFPKDISAELGTLPVSMARAMRTPGAAAPVGGSATEASVILDDLAHIR